MITSRLVCLATAVGLLAMLGAASPAVADSGSLTCDFTGYGSTPNPNIPDALNSLSRPFETGGLTLTGLGTCALADTDTMVAVGAVTISASGGFSSLICGTGIWAMHGTIAPDGAVAAGGWGNHAFVDTDFTVAFVAGQGAVVLTSADDGDGGDDGDVPTGEGAGYVNIVPVTPQGVKAPISSDRYGNCVGEDVGRWFAQGTFTLAA